MQSEWTTAPGPGKFEAGTLPLTQIAGFRFAAGELIGYMAHDARHEMLRYLRDELSAIPRVRLVSGDGAALLTFATDGMHPLDFGARAGARGVCLRAGNMCASWAHHALGLSGTIRISVGWWNTMDEMARISRVAKDILGRE
jgi:selenocysteine lyase/cysteine desulfurase